MVISRTASPSRRSVRLIGVLFAVVLAVLGGTSPVAAAPHQPVQAAGAHAVSAAPGPDAADDAFHMRVARSAPPLLAGQPDAPLLPEAARENPAWDRSVLPAPPSVSAAHLAHRSPRHGRAPPSPAGI
ncbi:hypothetical protein H181DRAFT_04475 [Streptomyces sp. WMMB 714]|uniref:hypothetical protein n=1 Tax=Streptomyces sp. WMMB 714 TaxID=1286822 RepID=UPI0005F83610|nr:hypothetical protein [Streptomyces sp. WMMB 714]SCK49750.1 hypothetical protein H181DRAFT_04475 [Streptomyces sp. WMMB 714]